MQTSCLFSRAVVIFSLLLFIHLSIWPENLENAATGQVIPENWEARLEFEDYIFAPVGRLSESIERRYEQKENSAAVHFAIKKNASGLFLLFLTEDDDGGLPQIKSGNISIKRDPSDGKIQYMTVLLRNRDDSYARIYPLDDRAYMSIDMFGIRIYDQIKLPVRFSLLLTAPFSKSIGYTRDVIDWDLLLYRGEPSDSLDNLVEALRKQLPSLKDCDDGAYDRMGNPVYIESEAHSPGGMNCSGFAKWVVDGFYYPLRRQYMEIASLKMKPLAARGNRWSERYEDKLDPFFGLDWSRNLAGKLSEARSGLPVTNVEKNDVRQVSFVSYVEDVGYNVVDLELILFVLARKNPDQFYLGSLNHPFAEKPALRQHTHVVVLIPVFSQDGSFQVQVMERNSETSLSSLVERYKNSQIHLVRISADKRFQPLKLD